MGKVALLLLAGALVAFGCSGDDDGSGAKGSGGSDASTGGTTGGTAGAPSGGSAGVAGVSAGGTAGSADASSGGSPGSGGGSAGTCPTSPPTLGEACTDYATCCYGPDEIPFYCFLPSSWEPHPSGRSCCPAVEPEPGGECYVVPYLECCYGEKAYHCNGADWSTTQVCTGR